MIPKIAFFSLLITSETSRKMGHFFLVNPPTLSRPGKPVKWIGPCPGLIDIPYILIKFGWSSARCWCRVFRRQWGRAWLFVTEARVHRNAIPDIPVLLRNSGNSGVLFFRSVSPVSILASIMRHRAVACGYRELPYTT